MYELIMPVLYYLQLWVLRLIARAKPAWNGVPLFAPFCWFNCGGLLPLSSYKEIFVDNVYAPPVVLAENAHILDIGAHLGFATMYFAGLYPDAQIESFEANPKAASLLKKNISHIRNVSAFSVAVGTSTGNKELFIEHINGIPTDASTILHDPHKKVDKVSVELCDIRSLTKEPIDLIKMDIEGGEFSCLEALDPHPKLVRCLVVEFHDYTRGTKRINRILGRLKERGYLLWDDKHQTIQLPLIPEHDGKLIWATANH